MDKPDNFFTVQLLRNSASVKIVLFNPCVPVENVSTCTRVCMRSVRYFADWKSTLRGKAFIINVDGKKEEKKQIFLTMIP